MLCRLVVKDVHDLQSLVSTHSEESDSVPFILCLKYQMLFTCAFSKQNSVISLEECVLVFKVFTTATRKLKVKEYLGETFANDTSRQSQDSGSSKHKLQCGINRCTTQTYLTIFEDRMWHPVRWLNCLIVIPKNLSKYDEPLSSCGKKRWWRMHKRWNG